MTCVARRLRVNHAAVVKEAMVSVGLKIRQHLRELRPRS